MIEFTTSRAIPRTGLYAVFGHPGPITCNRIGHDIGFPLIQSRLLKFDTIQARSGYRTEVTVMSVNWIKDADEALNQAKEQNKPLLIDFSAAPA